MEDLLRQNIISMYNQCSLSECKEGMGWYENANLFCKYLSNTYSINFEIACSVVAHLSPRNRWERNKEDAENLIKSVDKHSVSVATFGRNKEAAIEVLEKRRPRMPKGNKTGSFYLNIVMPSCSKEVTVDSHAYCIAKGVREVGPNITSTDYIAISKAYRGVASSLGIRPHQVQACTWLAFKRIHKI